MRASEFISEVQMDASNGAGAVVLNANVDYYGIRVAMTPTNWLTLAHELKMDAQEQEYVDKLADYIEQGGKIAQPWLYIDIPDEWEAGDLAKTAKVTGHEGRHRMEAILQVEGDVPVEVHLFFPGLRARHITPQWIARLNKTIIGERGKLIAGPLFKAFK